MEREYKVIAIDFDNTIFATEYPKLLFPIMPVILWAKKRREHGDRLILWTCREGPELEEAVAVCRELGLEFDAVNDNIPELKEQWGNNPRKISADWYIDDKNVIMVHDCYGNDTDNMYTMLFAGGRITSLVGQSDSETVIL